MTAALSQTFEEQLQEIETYLDLLEVFEVQAGRIGEATITAQQQKILYSSVYLQIYNLVEATITWCVEAVRSAACGPWAVEARRSLAGIQARWRVWWTPW